MKRARRETFSDFNTPVGVPSATGEPRLDAATPEEEGPSPPLVARYRAGVSHASGWTSARAKRADARTARVVMFGSTTSHTASAWDRASVPPGTARASPSGGCDADVVHDADAPTSATREPASGETLLVRLPRPRPRPPIEVGRDASRDRRHIRARGRRRDPRSARLPRLPRLSRRARHPRPPWTSPDRLVSSLPLFPDAPPRTPLASFSRRRRRRPRRLRRRRVRVRRHPRRPRRRHGFEPRRVPRVHPCAVEPRRRPRRRAVRASNRRRRRRHLRARLERDRPRRRFVRRRG